MLRFRTLSAPLRVSKMKILVLQDNRNGRSRHYRDRVSLQLMQNIAMLNHRPRGEGRQSEAKP
jgi:hypothetical protein